LLFLYFWLTIQNTANRQVRNLFYLVFIFFGNFWLTIQNTTNRHVSNAFDLIVVFISFPLARAAAAAAVAADFRCCCCWAPPPHPAPFILGEGSTKKIKSPVASRLAFGHVCVGVGDVGVSEVGVLFDFELDNY
jgi:hypothetical protein